MNSCKLSKVHFCCKMKQHFNFTSFRIFICLLCLAVTKPHLGIKRFLNQANEIQLRYLMFRREQESKHYSEDPLQQNFAFCWEHTFVSLTNLNSAYFTPISSFIQSPSHPCSAQPRTDSTICRPWRWSTMNTKLRRAISSCPHRLTKHIIIVSQQYSTV